MKTRLFIHVITREVVVAKGHRQAWKSMGLTYSQGQRLVSDYSPSDDKDAILPSNLLI